MRVWTQAAVCAALGMAAASAASAASIVLYDQDFETPNDPPGFVNGSVSGYDDLSQQTVNELYGGQPSGFTFAQTFTVETALLTGNEAFGTGYIDSTGRGGNYAIGMLESVENDLLGLSFDLGGFDFFNFSLDVSSLGLSGGPGNGPFASDSIAPIFEFSLYDEPGSNGTGAGALLATARLTGTASPLSELVWTSGLFAFDASGSTNGNVTLRVDLVQGGYAVMDNWRITASDTPGEGFSVIPVPATLPLLLGGFVGLGWLGRRRRKP